MLFIVEATARSGRRNLALKKPTWQSSTYSGFSTSDKAVDGCTKNEYTSRCCIHSGEEWRPWWEVDLGAVYNIGEIVMTKRWDCGQVSFISVYTNSLSYSHDF